MNDRMAELQADWTPEEWPDDEPEGGAAGTGARKLLLLLLLLLHRNRLPEGLPEGLPGSCKRLIVDQCAEGRHRRPEWLHTVSPSDRSLRATA